MTSEELWELIKWQLKQVSLHHNNQHTKLNEDE